jgi:DNA-binding MurR/RpiR family transcriptional regulator
LSIVAPSKICNLGPLPPLESGGGPSPIFLLTSFWLKDINFSPAPAKEILFSAMLKFYSHIKGRADLLPQAQRKLLEFILAHEEESVFLRIRDLARRGGVSQATVTRLSRALGFRGFPEFQKELQRHFRDKLTTTSRLQKTAKKVGSERDVFTKVLQTDMENISGTLRETSLPEFRRFVKCLASADRIVIVGLRSIHSLAIFMAVALEFLQREVWLVQPGIGDMWDRMVGLKKGDVVLGISFPRYTKETVNLIHWAKTRGVPTLAITDSPLSPLAQHADHVLTARYQTDSFIESFTAPLSLINALVTALGIQDRTRTLASLRKLEEVWKRQEIYYPPGKER